MKFNSPRNIIINVIILFVAFVVIRRIISSMQGPAVSGNTRHVAAQRIATGRAGQAWTRQGANSFVTKPMQLYGPSPTFTA